MCLFSQLGPNIKELFRLLEDFVDVIGLRMKDFQDMYEVTDNLGQPYRRSGGSPQLSLLIKTNSLITAFLSLKTHLHNYSSNR